ncbi:SHOCT domain-containing protein [Vibrio breoganii]|nr:SHOCT domain-containing protein [Vibrio breoganii]
MNRGEIADEIEQLDALRKSGAITEAEFQKRKTFLLNY